MNRNGLTLTMIFLAESANYGEGVGNISTLKKMTRGNYEQYSYISRQALRYNIVQQAHWDDTPVREEKHVVQFAPSATIQEYPEIDLFGYMKTSAKGKEQEKGGAITRSAVVRLSNAISLEPYQSDLEFLTNMGLARRQGLVNGIAQSEVQRSFYTYTVSVDLDRVGADGEITIPLEERAGRVQTLLETLQFLYRDIKGRRENLAPVFVIGGRYERKNPFFENRVKIDANGLCADLLLDVLEQSEDVKEHTYIGMLKDVFGNDAKVREKLRVLNVKEVFEYLKKEAEEYYGESN